MICFKTLFFLIIICTCASANAQDSSLASQSVSIKYLDKISSRSDQLGEKLDKKSEKALRKLQKQEAKMKTKLFKIDSVKAASVFENAEEKYKNLEHHLQNNSLSKKYIGSLDTIASSLKFIRENPQLLSKAKDAQKQLKNAAEKVNGLQDKFQKAEEVKQFLKDRRQYLKDQLGQLGFAKELKQLNKQVYYYNEQLNEYKAMLKDHKKAEKKAISLLSKTKPFKEFMRKNSQLASLFRLPGNPADPTSQVGLAGLQTRVQVNSLMQQRIASGGAGAQGQFQQNVQQAQNQLNQLKNKLTQLGHSSNEVEMPDGFKPNNQKSKSFLKRLELGTNIQSQKANGYFPTTSDIGISLGYKLNDRSVVGIGSSYKMGWGKNIRHINISHQGLGMRSFMDWKIKNSIWISGGYEMNYRKEFNRIDVLKDLNTWQRSGLLGMSKLMSLKTKFFKNTKLQLLWDFLSYQQIPRTQPIIFRIGYVWR